MLPSTNIAAVPATLWKIIENYLTNLRHFSEVYVHAVFFILLDFDHAPFLVIIFQQFDWFSEWLKPDPFFSERADIHHTGDGSEIPLAS